MNSTSQDNSVRVINLLNCTYRLCDPERRDIFLNDSARYLQIMSDDSLWHHAMKFIAFVKIHLLSQQYLVLLVNHQLTN